jgi:ABC-type sugar transport system substrate-binding protein
MKKNLRRIMCCVLAFVLAVSLCFNLVGCTKSGGNSSETTTSGNNSGSTVKAKIGMIWYGNTDAMGGTFYAWANHAAEILNVELVWKLGSYTTADELTDCENLISAGCNGIYFIPMDTSANLQLGNACKDAGVYWSTSNRDIIDKDVLATCEANPYFVNRIYDNSYDVCKEMVKVLADQGIKKVCVLSGDPTDAMMVDRNKGFTDGAKEYGITILATSQIVSGDSAANVDSVNNFLTLYPDVQGILAVSGTAGVGEAIITALEGSNREKGSVKVAAFDTFDGNKAAFENGWLSASCGGYTTECLISFLSLVNRVQGNVISDKVAVMTLSPLLITSAEEMDIFSQYVDNPTVQLYSDDLIKSLVGPDVTLEDYQKVLDDWSIDFVKTAAGLK